MKIRKCALCKSRHEIFGVSESIFPMAVDFSDLREINMVADRYVCQTKLDGCELALYVTGVQYPLVAVINACLKRDVKLTLYHYNPNTNEYYAQELYQKEEEESK